MIKLRWSGPRTRPHLWTLLLLVWGPACQWGSSEPLPPAQPFKGVELKAAVVGDPGIIPTLNAQRGEWAANRGAEVAIQSTPLEVSTSGSADVLIFRAELLGALVNEGRLANFPEATTSPPTPTTEDNGSERDQDERTRRRLSEEDRAADALQFSGVAPAYRDQVAKYGDLRVALPYGGSALVVVYHRDAFENEANLAAAKEAKLELKPPTTWDEFDALARFFHGRDWDHDGKPESGVALAFGLDAEGVADSTYLARAASLGQYPDQFSFLFDADSMAPRIDSPPFVEALQKLAALKAYGPDSQTIQQARAAFAEREAVLLIDRAEHAADWGTEGPIGVAPLPGSSRVYNPSRNEFETLPSPNRPSYLPFGGGWLVGVNNATQGKVRDAAIDFAKYLITPDIASRVRSDPAFPMLAVRASLLSQGPPDPRAAQSVDSRQWSDATTETLYAARVVPGLRIPDANGYLEDLAKTRIAVGGGADADQALKDLAQSWTERTKRLGVARQLWHYRRSLNNLATSPEPPAR